MKTADYPVWLAVLPDQRDAARADAGKHPDGGNAITWDKEAQLWYARPGADLSRLQKWLPDRSIRSSGGGDPQSEFLDALTSGGLVLDGLPVMDGRRHRVPVADGKKGNKDGVYRGFLDGVKPAGWFINYHRADNDKDITRWKSSGGTGEADPVARVHIRAVMRQSKDDTARAQATLYTNRTASAQALYNRLPAVDPAHGYLERKGITATPELRQTRNGALVVPFYDAGGQFRTLQYIPPDGEKYLFKDAPKSGHFLVVGGELKDGEPVLYAEGYATARSLNMVTGRPVVMAIDAGNMEAVGNVLKARYPGSPHLFMADVDHKKDINKGVLSAERAATATGGAVVLPDLSAAEIERGLKDFNDLHQFRGTDRLRESLLPDITRALEGLNYKETAMATPDDAQPAPDTIPAASPDAAAESTPVRRPGAAKEKTDEILKLRDEGLKPAQIAEQLGIGQTSVYRILKAQQTDAPAVDSTPPAATVIEPASPAAASMPAEVASEPDVSLPSTGVTSTAEAQPVTAPAAESVAATPVTPAPASPGTYDGFTGLYGTGAELRDRLAALGSGQISPAALLQDISTLRSRVESAAITGVYTPEHVKEMLQVFDRVTQGGMAGADVMESGAFSRLRGLLGQRDTWSSLHPTGGMLDVNTVPERVAQQYALLARGDVTRAQFDREVRMLHGEFTRADPGRFTPGRQEETRAMFERMASLESPERAAQYSAGMAVLAARLPAASAADPNATALDRIQTALRDEFVSLARGETAAPALTENVARLQVQLDDAKTLGVYAGSHLKEVQSAFDRVTQGGLAGMPLPDAPAPRGDYLSRNPGSASLDVASVPSRIEAEIGLLVRGEVTRAQFEDNLAVLRNEVVRLSETGKVSPAALSAAEGAFANLGAQPAPLPVPVASSAAPSSEPAAAPAPVTVASPDMAAGAEPATPVTEANVTAPQASAAVAATPSEPPVAPQAAPAVVEPPAATPAASATTAPVDFSADFSDINSRLRALKDEAGSMDTDLMSMRLGALVNERIGLTEMLAQGNSAENARPPSEESEALEAELRAELDKRPDADPSPFAAAFSEENAILVGAPRVAPQDEDAPVSSGAASSRIDADKLLSRVTHEKHPDGKSVMYKLDGEPAFIDRGNRLVMAEGASAHQEKVLAALLTAANHYQGRIELTGSDEFKAFAIGVIVANKLDVSMKNASQQADLDAARRAAGQPVTPAAPADAVRGDPQAPRATDTPPVTPNVPAAPAEPPAQSAVPVTASQQRNSAPAPEPAAPKTSPAVHTPAEKAREPVTGKVTACGQAPFRFEAGQSESTFITLRTNEGPQTFWGKELAGLLRETNLKPGRMVTLQWQGEQPVTVKVPQKNDEGVITHYKSVETHRNQWALAPAGGSRVQTGADDLVPLAAVDVNRYIQIQHTLVSRLGLDVDAPPKPADGLYWLKPDGQGSAQAGDPLSAPRPAHNDRAGTPVMSAWGDDGRLDLHLVQGDGDYLQGVVRHNGAYQHVLVSLPDSKESPPMVVNLLTPEGAQPIGSGNGINRSNGQPVAREHVAVRLTGDAQPRIAKLDAPADVPAALHARLGYDERFKAESGWVKEQPAAAPQAAPVTPPRPAQ